MRKSSVIPLFLIGLLLMHQIVVPAVAIVPAVALVAGLVGGALIGGAIDHYLAKGVQNAEEFKEKYENLLNEYEKYKAQSMLENIGTLATVAFADHEQYKIAMDNIEDLLHYTKNYAWSLVKYDVYKCRSEGKSCMECYSEVTEDLHNYYKKVADRVVAIHNTQVESLQKLVEPLHGTVVITKSCGESIPDVLGGLEIRISVYMNDPVYYAGKYGLFRIKLTTSDGDDYCNSEKGDYYVVTYKWFWRGHRDIDTFKYTTVSYQLPNLKINYTLKVYKMSGDVHAHYIDPNGNDIVKHIWVITPSKTYTAYDYDKTTGILDKIDLTYKQMVDNAVNYIQQIYTYNINVSEVIDPYVLASFMSQQANETGYFAYYSAEMALLGLPTNLSTAFTIKLNGKEYTGYLFTDSVDVLKRNKTYNLTGYFATDDGRLISLNNAPVMITNITNPLTGEQLNESHLEKYTSDSIDPKKIEEEFKKLNELYQYLQNLSTTVGGGSSVNSWANTINDFWNNLDWQVKAVIVGGLAVGVIGLVARGRRGG
jgi:hypothetical protein